MLRSNRIKIKGFVEWHHSYSGATGGQLCMLTMIASPLPEGYS